MLHNKKIIFVMPAYNASKTLEMTYKEIPMDVVDEVVLVYDTSRDDTVEKALKYFTRASSIFFASSGKYGLRVLSTLDIRQVCKKLFS